MTEPLTVPVPNFTCGSGTGSGTGAKFSSGRVLILTSDRPGVKFQPGPGSNFLAGGIDSGRGRGFLVKIWSSVLSFETLSG